MSTERQENERPAKLTPQARQQNLGALLQEFGQTREAIENELAKVVVGQKDAIRQIFADLLHKEVVSIDLPQSTAALGAALRAVREYKKAKEELGWIAEKDLEDMCKDSWNYIEKNK